MQQMLCFFFFNDTATTEIYTLSLHDALPISSSEEPQRTEVLRRAGVRSSIRNCKTPEIRFCAPLTADSARSIRIDRKSTRLNSSHANISYAVFCLKKKKNTNVDSHSITSTPL